MMWALGKVVNTPEVMRVYVGSFWDYPILDVEFKRLFEAEHNDLLHDLATLPRCALPSTTSARCAPATTCVVVVHARSQWLPGSRRCAFAPCRGL
jgi:hypothetical protein